MSSGICYVCENRREGCETGDRFFLERAHLSSRDVSSRSRGRYTQLLLPWCSAIGGTDIVPALFLCHGALACFREEAEKRISFA